MPNAVIVCGMPRSGTRMVANIMNSSKEVYVTAEFPSGINEKMFRLVEGMDSFFESRAYKSEEGWEKEKVNLIQRIWVSNSLSGIDISSVKLIGNKTPSNEFFFERYERHLQVKQPRYIYCLRSPLKVLSSLKNMPWNKESVLQNWEKWKASFQKLQQMNLEAPGRVLVVSFDDPLRGSVTSVGRRIFDFLGLEVTQSVLDSWKGSKPAQPKESVLKGEKVIDLSSEEVDLVRCDDFYQRLMANYNYLDSCKGR